MVAVIQVECLEAVLEAGSFRGAVPRLHMSQTAISGHVAKLEDELRIPLLRRSAGGSVLTPEGQRMMPHLRAFMASAASIRRATDFLRTRARATLDVMSYRVGLNRILPPAFGVLRESFGSLTIRLVVGEGGVLYDALTTGRCEVGLELHVEGQARPPGITATELTTLGVMGVAGRADDPLMADTGPLGPAALAGRPLVLVPSLVQHVGHLLPLDRCPFITEVPDGEVAVQMVEAGAGLAVMGTTPRLVTTPELRWRPMVGAPAMSIEVLVAASATLSPPAAAVVDYLHSWSRTVAGQYRLDPHTGMQPVDPVH